MGKKRTSDEVGTPEAKLPINRLEDRQFEILKQEIGLLEGRIIHLEGLQYRLRQFSILLWSMILTVGFGVTKLLADADARLIAASLGVPLVFGFLDAWYARAAQRFRTRRVEIAEYFNSTDDKPIVYPITLLDMMASQRRKEGRSAGAVSRKPAHQVNPNCPGDILWLSVVWQCGASGNLRSVGLCEQVVSLVGCSYCRWSVFTSTSKYDRQQKMAEEIPYDTAY